MKAKQKKQAFVAQAAAAVPPAAPAPPVAPAPQIGQSVGPSPDELSETLADYEEIPRESWHLLRYNTHIKYTTVGGELKSGGFIAQPRIEAKDNPDIIRMRLQSNTTRVGGAGYDWLIDWKNIARLWARKDAQIAMLEQIIVQQSAQINSNNDKFVQKLQALEAQIRALKIEKS